MKLLYRKVIVSLIVAATIGAGASFALAPKAPARAVIKSPKWPQGDNESDPFVWEGHLYAMIGHRAAPRSSQGSCIEIRNLETGAEVSTLAGGYGFGSVLSESGTVTIFATHLRGEFGDNISSFQSTDLLHWSAPRILLTPQNKGEHYFNTTVCRTPYNYVMSVDSDINHPGSFEQRFALSYDLQHWTLTSRTFGGPKYEGCACIRYADGWYYLITSEPLGHTWVTRIYRSHSLGGPWGAGKAPFLNLTSGDMVDASDAAVIEFQGRTHLLYLSGNQVDTGAWHHLTIPMPLPVFLKAYF